MSNYEHGRVLAVNETTLGSELVSAHAAGVMSLTVEDPVDFDEDGGWLKIGDQVVEYSTYDDDTGEITLKTALEEGGYDGQRVLLWDQLRQVVTTDKVAQVELDGDDDNTDPLEATIPLHLLDDLEEGIRGTTGESILLEQDGDEWRIIDVLGLAAAGASGTQFWQDTHVVQAAGAQTITLTHEPKENSEHVYWGPLYQGASQWSRSGKTITVPDPAGHVKVDDVFTVEYAYRVGVVAPRGESYRAGSAIPLGVGGAPGDYLVAAVMVAGGYSANGYTATETVALTRDIGDGETLTRKLVVFTGVIGADGVLPAITPAAGAQIWVTACLPGVSETAVAVATTNGATSAASPAVGEGKVLRVWGTLGDVPTLTPPSALTLEAGHLPEPYPGSQNDMQIAICSGGDGGEPYTANSSISAGWFMAAVSG